jgi:alkylation response protein AidB-like acyl-CoA dehydrogenase
MDLTFTDAEQAFREEARSWLAANVPKGLPPMDVAEGFALHKEWEALLFEHRWSVVSWPEAYGGRKATPIEWLIFEEEYWGAGGPGRVSQNGIFLLAPTMFEHGTQEQQDRFLPTMASAEVTWAQGWSEPNAGSDLASISSKAVRDGDGWRLSGQKTWSTRAGFCDWAFGMFRSDPEAQRHKGLTYFLWPLDAEGITVRPVKGLGGGDAFAEIFLDDVYVPDSQVLGEVHGGWGVAMATASSERGLTLRSPGRFLATAERLQDLARREGVTDPAVLEALARAWIHAEAYRLQTYWTISHLAEGGRMGAEASITKIWWSELDIELHEVARSILGPRFPLEGAAAASVDGGAWLDGFLFSLAGPIYAGTNEIQRNVVAERVLGLPRK